MRNLAFFQEKCQFRLRAIGVEPNYNSMLRVLVLCLGFFGILATMPLPVVASTSTAMSKPKAGPTPPDAQIDATIRAKLAKSKIGKDGFHFKVARGVVTWEGKTDVIQHKGSATRMAKSAGATQVINNIQISDAAKAKAANNLKKNTSSGTGTGTAGGIKRASVS
jgi:hypothetical protein